MGAAALPILLLTQAHQQEQARRGVAGAQAQSRREQEDLQKRQRRIIERQPRKVDPITPQSRRLAIRRGIARNIRTSARGVTGAPTLATASLIGGGGKTLLGQ